MAANDEWFKPMHRRVITFLFAAGLFVAEWLLWGEEIWLWLFGGLAAFCFYDFFLSGKYENRLGRK